MQSTTRRGAMRIPLSACAKSGSWQTALMLLKTLEEDGVRSRHVCAMRDRRALPRRKVAGGGAAAFWSGRQEDVAVTVRRWLREEAESRGGGGGGT